MCKKSSLVFCLVLFFALAGSSFSQEKIYLIQGTELNSLKEISKQLRTTNEKQLSELMNLKTTFASFQENSTRSLTGLQLSLDKAENNLTNSIKSLEELKKEVLFGKIVFGISGLIVGGMIVEGINLWINRGH